MRSTWCRIGFLALTLAVLAGRSGSPARADDDPGTPTVREVEDAARSVDLRVTSYSTSPMSHTPEEITALVEALSGAWDAAEEAGSGLSPDDLNGALVLWRDAVRSNDTGFGSERRRRRSGGGVGTVATWDLEVRPDGARATRSDGNPAVVVLSRGARRVTTSGREGRIWITGLEAPTRPFESERAWELASHHHHTPGWPCDLLGAPDLGPTGDVRTALQRLAPGGADARLPRHAVLELGRARVHLWFAFDDATAPFPSRTLQVFDAALGPGRRRVVVFATRCETVTARTDAAPCPLVPARNDVQIWDSGGADRAQTSGSGDATRWPTAWFNVLEPDARFADLARRVRATGEGPEEEFAAALAAVGASRPLRTGSPWLLLAAVVTGAGLIALTFRATRRPRPRLVATGVAGVLASVALALAVHVSTPDTIWCLDRTPVFGQSYIVATSPGGAALPGDWQRSADGPASIELVSHTDGIARELEQATNQRRRLYTPTGAEVSDDLGTWRELKTP